MRMSRRSFRGPLRMPRRDLPEPNFDVAPEPCRTNFACHTATFRNLRDPAPRAPESSRESPYPPSPWANLGLLSAEDQPGLGSGAEIGMRGGLWDSRINFPGLDGKGLEASRLLTVAKAQEAASSIMQKASFSIIIMCHQSSSTTITVSN